MTDLTDKWKKGELSLDKSYYLRLQDGSEEIQMYVGGFLCNENNPVDEVLAPVPSYDEWEQLQNWADFTNDYHGLREKLEIAEYEKAELKELLKKCKRQFEEVALYRYDIADDDQEDWFKISTEQAGIANKMIAKIDQALGEDK